MAYGNDEQRRHAEKDAVLCIASFVSRHYCGSHPLIAAGVCFFSTNDVTMKT